MASYDSRPRRVSEWGVLLLLLVMMSSSGSWAFRTVVRTPAAAGGVQLVRSRLVPLKRPDAAGLPPVCPSGRVGTKPVLSPVVVGAGSDAIFPSSAPGSSGNPLKDKLKALWGFTRPHTIRGTVLGSVMGVVRCLLEHPKAISLDPLPLAVMGVLALFCGNVFIVGINQIYDIEIDKVNKPFLPLAADRMSRGAAWALVVASCSLGLLITNFFFSKLIFFMYLAGIVAGGLYSIPPFYFKRFPAVAALTIAFVRGFSLNFGVYYAVRESLGIAFQWNPIVVFITRFMTVFAAVIAVTKDLPDTEGDIKFNVNTFAARVGVQRLARGASLVLGLNYVSAIVEGMINPGGAFRRLPMVGGHVLLGLLLLKRYLELKGKGHSLAGIKEYYKGIWDLFYLEYCLYPLL